ncbi:mitochondrial calcium uniporter regulator 1-like isoform X2 [Gigantopelta aegis]|nr:mitochondrial calcium uniporter regulator 1-like isoform X2 [Gigantopelta aegis]
MKQVHYLDTLAVAKMLEKHGFSRENSEGLTQCLADVVSTTLEHQARHMVMKPQQEIVVQQMMSEISSVKKDMVLLQKTEFSTLRNETEKQALEISQVKDMLQDEIIKISGKITLDINLERGRALEAHAENEKKLQQLHNKIEMEVAHLRTTYEQYRNDVFKYAAGTVLTCAGLCLGIIRMWSH